MWSVDAVFMLPEAPISSPNRCSRLERSQKLIWPAGIASACSDDDGRAARAKICSFAERLNIKDPLARMMEARNDLGFMLSLPVS